MCAYVLLSCSVGVLSCLRTAVVGNHRRGCVVAVARHRQLRWCAVLCIAQPKFHVRCHIWMTGEQNCWVFLRRHQLAGHHWTVCTACLPMSECDDLSPWSLACVLVWCCYSCVISMMRIFPPQRNLMMRETSVGYYGIVPYFMAQTLYDSFAGMRRRMTRA